MPKIGWVKFIKSRETEGEIKQVTVKKEGDHWYVCFSCEIDRLIEKKPLDIRNSVGIDVGISSYATVVCGLKNEPEKVENPKFFKKEINLLLVDVNLIKLVASVKALQGLIDRNGLYIHSFILQALNER